MLARCVDSIQRFKLQVYIGYSFYGLYHNFLLFASFDGYQVLMFVQGVTTFILQGKFTAGYILYHHGQHICFAGIISRVNF